MAALGRVKDDMDLIDNSHGRSLLLEAVFRGHVDLVDQLVENKIAIGTCKRRLSVGNARASARACVSE